MENHYNFYDEMICGAFLATFIGFAPKYLMELRLGLDVCRPECMLSYSCPGIWIYVSSAVLAGVFLMYGQCRRWHFLVQLIWLVVCLFKYLSVLNSEACVLNNLKDFSGFIGPLTCGICFFILFCLTAYQVIKWVIEL